MCIVQFVKMFVVYVACEEPRGVHTSEDQFHWII